MRCEHQFILDLDAGFVTGRMYCLKCSEEKHDPDHDCKFWRCEWK